MNQSSLWRAALSVSPKRYAALFLGHVGMTLGIALMSWCGAGNASFPAMLMAISMKTGCSYGNVTLAVHTACFLIELLLGRRYIHVGTIVNWIVFGYMVDFWRMLLRLVPYNGSMVVFLIGLSLGFFVFVLGIAIYQEADAGIGPYDSLPLITCDRSGLPFFWVRLAYDTAALVICLLFGGWQTHQIGVVTVLSAFGIGPLVAFFSKTWVKPRLNRGHFSA